MTVQTRDRGSTLRKSVPRYIRRYSWYCRRWYWVADPASSRSRRQRRWYWQPQGSHPILSFRLWCSKALRKKTYHVDLIAPICGVTALDEWCPLTKMGFEGVDDKRLSAVTKESRAYFERVSFVVVSRIFFIPFVRLVQLTIRKFEQRKWSRSLLLLMPAALT